MRKIWKRPICLAVLAALCLSWGLAFSAGNGKLTVSIGDESSSFDRKGIRIALYKVGSEVAEDVLQLDAAFSGITLHGTMTAQEIKDALEEIRQIIIDLKMEPTTVIETNENGEATVNGLELGIYYGVPVEVPKWLSVQEFLISIPLMTSGSRNLNATAELKHKYEEPSTEPPEETESPSPSPSPTLVPPPNETPTDEEITAEPTQTPRPTERPTPGPHRLIIHYIYADSGKTAAPDHNETLWEGERYDVWSPILPGYWYDTPEVPGIMPNHDMEYTVMFFTKKQGWKYITLEDYETALGIGMIQMHVGVCYE